MEFWLKVLTFSLPAGRVLGIPLRINWLLLLFMPALIRPFLAYSGILTPTIAFLMGLIFVVVLYGSILLHELGHAWGTRLVGNSVREIQLTPLGGVAIGEGHNASPRAELIVVGLGPAVSILLALAGWILRAGVRSWEDAPLLLSFTVGSVFSINMMLAMFNLLVPVFPLDSAKLLRAGLSLRFNPQKVTYYLAQAGIGLAVLILVAGVFGIPLPGLGAGSAFLWFIMIIAIQACMYVLRDVEYNQVYESYDQWGEKPVYYDTDLMTRIRMRVSNDLRRLTFRKWVRPYQPKGEKLKRVAMPEPVTAARSQQAKGPARVVDATPRAPEAITDPAELRALMRAAADREDFETAARLKRRLKEITGSEK